MIEKIKNLFKKIFISNWFEDINNIVAYICGNEALPLPLESSEERVLLEELADGNEYARQKLIEHNLRLVVFIAKRFENTGIDMEDLISTGAIGLIKAIKSYDLSKNIKLATYASRCIENEILMQLRKTSKRKCEVSIDEPLTYDGEGNELKISDILSQSSDTVTVNIEKSVEKQLLFDSIKKLNSREQSIMVMRFGLCGKKEKTQKEVAEMLGISQSYISRIEKKILDKLKKDLQKII